MATEGNDTISGTTADEFINGMGGDDSLLGQGGNDTLHGGNGNDSVIGGAGNDLLFGQAGDDLVDGGLGNDMACYNGSLSQYVITQGASEGDFFVSGPEGNDTLTGIEMFDFGGEQFMPVEGTENPDEIQGTLDDDIIFARGGHDFVDGGAGDDALFGEAGNDTLLGGTGDDFLDGGSGVDSMAGGSGNDTYVVDNELDVVTESDLPLPMQPGGPLPQVSIGTNIDKVIASITYSLGSAVENLQLSGTQDLAGNGNSAENVITGNAGHNELDGAAGNDTLDGGVGIDTAMYKQLQGADFQRTETGWVVTSEEGTDTLVNMERLDFEDNNIALDVEGNAGMVAKILGALLGEEFVQNQVIVGIGLGYADTGMGYEALMQLALDAIVGPDASMETVIRVLFFNIVGVQANDGHVAHFSSLGLTDVQLAMLAADHELNTNNIGLAGLMETGLAYID